MSDELLGLVLAAQQAANLEASINDDERLDEFLAYANCPYIEYTRWMMDFHCEYLNFDNGQVTTTAKRFYLLLKINNQSVGVLPVVVKNFPHNSSFGSNAGPLLPPFLLPSLSRKQQRKILQKCLSFYHQLAAHLNIKQLCSQFIFTPGESETWYNLLLEQGAVPKFSQELYCDLSHSQERYLSLIRDKYRSHIRKAAKLWDVQVKLAVNDELYQQFKQLHIEVVGFKTRSDHTWQQLQDAVNANNAFCVFVFDNLGKMIGAAQFSHTQAQAVYSVGVYDRSLFDQPLSHIVHYRAIEQMKAIGLKRYHIGARCHPSEWMQPSDKESQIGHFKEGFATESLFKVTLDWPLADGKHDLRGQGER